MKTGSRRTETPQQLLHRTLDFRVGDEAILFVQDAPESQKKQQRFMRRTYTVAFPYLEIPEEIQQPLTCHDRNGSLNSIC